MGEFPEDRQCGYYQNGQQCVLGSEHDPAEEEHEMAPVSEHLLSDDEAQTYLDIGVTANEVVRLLNPDATDIEASHLLWEHTPYPMVSGIHDLVDLLPNLECDCPPADFCCVGCGREGYIACPDCTPFIGSQNVLDRFPDETARRHAV